MDSDRNDFSLGFSRAGERVTVAVRGEVDCHTGVVLRERLIDVIEGQGNRSIALDLSGMTFIDSAGLSVLVDMYKRVVERGGTFVLHNPRPAAAKVFEIVGLSHILPILRV